MRRGSGIAMGMVAVGIAFGAWACSDADPAAGDGADTAGGGDTGGPCVPQCGGRECGDNGCNGLCGVCPANTGCDNALGQCVATACGNGVVEPGETCDPPSSCPVACPADDPCARLELVGAPDACNVFCRELAVTDCIAGDGCCPGPCDAQNDSDCGAECGNGEREGAETCDPPETCPTTCADDGDACTIDRLIGAATMCNVRCTHDAVASCRSGDGCCPAGCTSAADDDCGPSCASGTTWGADWIAYEDEAVVEMNQYRAAGATCVTHGQRTVYRPAGPLAMDDAARQAARCHSVDMAENDFFDHTGSDGRDFSERMHDAGYDAFARSENIAAGYPTPADVVLAWMESETGHCDAIMDPDANEVGIGYYNLPGSDYGEYWTADFGIR